MKLFQNPLLVLLLATSLEVTGDAIVRYGIHQRGWLARCGLFAVGTAFLFGYGLFLNLAPLEFGRVAGLYIATLFVVWQIINYFAFGSMPTFPIMVGGAFIITGGLMVSFWKSQ